MQTPYLIQRGTKRNPVDESKKGIDKLIKFDYMGSSEFEFGSLGDSLKRIRDNKGDLGTWAINVCGHRIGVFGKKTDRNEISGYIDGLYRDIYRLKERSAFKESFETPKSKYGSVFDFWWDIENDFMFWKSDSDFALMLESLI